MFKSVKVKKSRKQEIFPKMKEATKRN